MSADAAKKCFEENLKLFGNAQTQPEKFNLYNGLYYLASEVENINRKIDDLEQMLNQLAQIVQQSR